MTVKQLLGAWNDFWFTPASPSPICLFRIFYGLMALLVGVFWLPYGNAWFGLPGIVSVATVRELSRFQTFSIFFWCGKYGSAVTFTLLAAYLLTAFCLTIGLRTRLSAVCLWILMVSFHHRNPFILGGVDVTLRLAGFFLMFAPAGVMYSVDSLLKHRNTRCKNCLCEPWAQRLLQLLTTAIYWQAFWSKANSTNWLSGMAVYHVVHSADFSQVSVPWIFDQLWICKLLTWQTLATELSLCTLVWIKDLRYFVLLAGVVMHAGIDWVVPMPFFEYTMIALYINFLDPNDIERSIEFVKSCVSWKWISKCRRTWISKCPRA